MKVHLQFQCGQSTVEFAIIAAALVPIILAIILMAKYADIRHSATQASQYAVWEKIRSPAKSEAQITNEIRARFFTKTQRVITSNESVADNAAEYRTYWNDQGNRKILQKFSDVQKTNSQGGLGAAQQVFNVVPTQLSWMNLNGDGFWRSSVTVPLVNQTSTALSPFDSLGVQSQSGAALLGDAWTAFNKNSTKSTISDNRVTTPDLGLSLLGQGLAYTNYFFDLEADPGSFRNKNVDHDVVPCEYIINGNRNAC